MTGGDGALRACLTYKTQLEARLKCALEQERPRLQAELAAGERLIERLRGEPCETTARLRQSRTPRSPGRAANESPAPTP